MTRSLALALVWGLAGPALAANFVVDSSLDLPDVAPGDGVCLSADMSCTLRAAVQEANALAGPDTVTLPGGTIELDTIGASNENASAIGDLDVTSEIAIAGQGAGASIVQAGGDGSPEDRVFHVLPGGDLTLSDLTVRDGAGDSTLLGGGVYNQGALTLERCAVTDNRANVGGGVYNGGTLTVDTCTFAGNDAVAGTANADGGALFSAGASDTRIEGSTFEANTAGREGGAIRGFNSAILEVSNSTFSGNAGNEAVRAQNVEQTTLLHVTIAGSVGVGLSGFSFDGSHLLDVRNTIVSGSSGAECSFLGSLIPVTAGSLASDASCGFAFGSVDPMLGPLQDNGGATDTHLPAPASPAVDNATFPDCPAVDQRGVARPDGTGDPSGECDIGAVELVPEPGGWVGVIAIAAAACVRRRA